MNVFQELKKFLYQLLNSVDGLHSILITDRDGVPVISVSDEKAPELAMRASFLSTFGMATDQGSKLDLGKNKTIISIYSSYQVVQMNKLPLVVSFIANNICDTGHILSLESKIDPILQNLKNVVAEA
ncbi:ragulator complex protein LAMTOR3-A [Neodiprion pinetum]|uniref:Ragulator complex protein LAMTOR3-A n=1 Tax=Neodiprion lecontei TaxID=441921 RepID=A0A6J0C5H2_NEOLC|nr:ragulator complex protein LAMTOR3-A [Neodiprion lecontei]XP_046413700.1 ragulator complex protein LAMTOR3-A [Neodiprion fabricii]XP_046468871.1 ragulator complex protein LAMTOR3-A [Neodiprion pinetum]XP_046608493.1 ragulator complex protein LAMTOR3-A [Neodiprion virginianus]